mmetsp:Transcript_65479/g.203048  ORF Transcript_65479/g.203048 Transcript_65479/m.203048 type:complete len:308 (-) Transcript_65479:100-1023(-)
MASWSELYSRKAATCIERKSHQTAAVGGAAARAAQIGRAWVGVSLPRLRDCGLAACARPPPALRWWRAPAPPAGAPAAAAGAQVGAWGWKGHQAGPPGGLAPAWPWPSRACPLGRPPITPASGRARLASAAGALADAHVPRPHDVRPVAELLRFAALRHRPLRVLLLAVRLHLLHKRLLLRARRLAGGHLAAALILLLLLVEVLGVDDGDHVLLVDEAHRGRQGQAVSVLNPAHLLQCVHREGHLGDGGRDLGVGQLDAPELLLAGVPHHVARELLDEFQRLLRLVERQGPEGLLKGRELVRDLVAR